MKKRTISEVAVQRNISWIEAVENALAESSNSSFTKEIMKAAGKECAHQILTECQQILGKKPETIDELLEATNVRRVKQLNLDSLWKREGHKAHLKIDECGCTLVKAGLAKPNPVHCLCTVGMFETLFSEVCQGPVSVEVVKTIGDGDDGCEFYIHFETGTETMV
jgi:predicted hydrocarbon binding protein